MIKIDKPARRWLTFRLRTMLFLSVLVAFTAGWVAKGHVQSRKEQTIADELYRIGGRVRFAGPYDLPNVPAEKQAWWRRLLTAALGKRAVFAYCQFHSRFENQKLISDDMESGMNKIGKLSRLDTLSIDCIEIVNLTEVRFLKRLRNLHVHSGGNTPSAKKPLHQSPA